VVDFWGWSPRPAVTTLREPHVTKMKKKSISISLGLATAAKFLPEMRFRVRGRFCRASVPWCVGLVCVCLCWLSLGLLTPPGGQPVAGMWP
jgi:hypothetical protein